MSKCIIPWTNAEDEAIIKVMSTLTKNESIGDAFKKLTKRLDRSNQTIQFRWYRVLKKQNISKPTKQSKSSIPDKNYSKEELLEYARKNYPVGTKVKSNIIEVENLKVEINRLNQDIKTKDELLSAAQNQKLIGNQLLAELNTLYPNIYSCAYSESVLFQKDAPESSPIAMILVKVKGQKLKNSEKVKIKGWMKNRLNVDQIEVSFE